MNHLIRGGRLVDPASGLDAPGDLLIAQATIAAVGRVEAPGDAQVTEARGLIVCPGLIDMHVHLREPGFEHKETIATGAAAAAAGGFTAVCAEPNTDPPVDSPERVADAMGRAARSALVRVYPKACLTKGQAGKRASDAGRLKAAGAIALSDDGEPVLSDRVMGEALRRAAQACLPVTTHCEESPRSRAFRPGPRAYEAEADLVRRDVGLLAGLSASLHFSHLSLAESMESLAEASAHGLGVTAEVTPHHCLLSVDEIPDRDPNFKVNPPLRSRADRDAVAEALMAGVAQAVASDHAPHTPEEKAKGWEEAPFGVIGLETTLGVMLTAFVHSRRMSLIDLLAKMTCNPARILRLAAGRLSVGAAADVTLIDPDAEWVVEPRDFRSKARNCPFAGRPVRGRAVGLFIGGRAVMRDGEILAAASAGK